MKRRTSRQVDSLQLELFGNDWRTYTDREVWAALTPHAEDVADDWEGGYRLEALFNRLTPHRRQIAYAAIELYKRMEVRDRHRPQLTDSIQVYDYMRPLLGSLGVEEFWAIGMNQAMKVIGRKRISVGGLDMTPVDVRVIAKQLIEWQATACIVCHNHPSGRTRPSTADDRLTQALKAALQLLNIRLQDHVIVTADEYYSYSEECKL